MPGYTDDWVCLSCEREIAKLIRNHVSAHQVTEEEARASLIKLLAGPDPQP